MGFVSSLMSTIVNNLQIDVRYKLKLGFVRFAWT